MSMLIAMGTATVALAIWQSVPSRQLLRRVQGALDVAGLPLGAADRSGRLRVGETWLKVTLRIPHPSHVSVLVTVDEPALATDIQLTPEDFTSAIGQLAGITDLELGEPRFDRFIQLRCRDAAHAIAMFDPHTRRAALRAVQAGALFREGSWELEMGIRGRVTGEHLRRQFVAVAVADAAMRSAIERPLVSALAERARGDPARAVRRHALALLVQRRLAPPQTLAEACHDVDPTIRLLAAQTIGVAARETVVALLHDGPRSLRLDAATHLLQEPTPLSTEEARTVVAIAMDGLADPRLADAAAGVLGRLGSPAAAAALATAARTGNAPARRALTALRNEGALPSGALAIANDVAGELALWNESESSER